MEYEIVNHRDTITGDYPLYMACKFAQDKNLVELLLALKAEIDGPRFQSTFFIGDRQTKIEIDGPRWGTEIDRGGPFREDFRTLGCSRTPLMMAALNGNVEIVQLLIQQGADPTLEDAYGMNACHFARNCSAHIKKMLARAADVAADGGGGIANEDGSGSGIETQAMKQQKFANKDKSQRLATLQLLTMAE